MDSDDTAWITVPMPKQRRAATSVLAGAFLPTLILASTVFWSIVGATAARVIG